MLVAILAQAAVAAAPQEGVISYPASFFAAQQPANAGEMIGRLPGFVLDSGASVRGYEGSAGNVLIDGQRPATKTEDLDQILRRLPASRVERIDVIRGGAPGIDMQGKSVIANIVRKNGGGFRGLLAASQNHLWDGRTNLASRAEASGDWGPRKWEVAGFLGRGADDGSTDGQGLRSGPGGVLSPYEISSEGDNLNGQLVVVLESPAFGGTARANGRIASDKFKFEETDRLATPRIDESIVDVTRKDETELGLNFERDLTGRLKLELVGLRQTKNIDILSAFTAPGVDSRFDLGRDGSEVIGRAVLKYSVSPTISLEAGGENAVNKLTSAARFRNNGALVPLPAANVHVQETRREAFAKGTWRPDAHWTMDASLRFENSHIQADGDVVVGKTLRYLKPRLTVTWSPFADFQLRGRIEREVGQLDFDDFVATANFSNASGVSAGNPDLNPERAWVGEIAAERRFWERGSVTVTFAHYELSDVIDRGPIVSPSGQVFDRPANIGGGTKDTIKFDISAPLDGLGLKNATIKGSLTQRWSKVTDPTVLDTREISSLRPQEWDFNFTQDVPSRHFSYGADVYGAFRETAYRYNLVDVFKLRTFVHPFLEWRPMPDLNIRFEAPNITGRGLRRTQTVYPGLRNAGGQASLEDRDYRGGRMFYFRVRKTFGG